MHEKGLLILPHSSFSTEHLLTSNKLNAWCAALSEVFDVDTQTPFSFEDASMSSYLMDTIMLTHTVSPPLFYHRTSKHVALNNVDHILLELVISGQQSVHSNGKSILMQSGDIIFYDLTQNYQIRTLPRSKSAKNCKHLDLLIPRTLLMAATENIEALHTLILPKGTPENYLLNKYLTLAFELAPQMSVSHAPIFVRSLIDFILGILGQYKELQAICTKPLEGNLLQKIYNIIDQEIDNPALNSLLIEKHLHISRSRLYRFCEPWGGVSRMIRKRRLNTAYKLLRSTDGTHRLLDIALEVGYNSRDSFSRAFSREFMLLPSDVIQSGRISAPTENKLVSQWGLDMRYLEWAKRHI